MVKNNSDTDNNVLTKIDNESNFPINFQPIPKRFIVWDKFERRFHRLRSENGSWRYVFDIWEVQWFLERLDSTETMIVQSTNLFDKDGKEIFEGSIVEDFDELHWVVVIEDGMVRVRTEYERDEERRYLNRPISFLTEPGNWNQGNNEIEVIGHILSNPELMEKKNV